MVIWNVIRYIIIVGTSRTTVRTFTEAIIVTIRIITWDMVMMIWITIRFIILVRSSRIAIRIYIKVVVIINITIIIIELTHSLTGLENDIKMKSQPAAVDFESIS